MKRNPIPPEYPSWNTFTMLHVKSQEQCKALLEELDGSSNKLAIFYQAAMDEETINRVGIEPMKPLLDHLDQIVTAYSNSDSKEYAKFLGKLDAKFGISPFWGVGASPDHKTSDHSIAQVSQGGIHLPDRDYYFDEDKQEKRDKYVEHVARMMTLLGVVDNDTASRMAQRVMQVETKLAEAHMTRTENRDPHATYNKMSVEDLTNKCGSVFAFDAYFSGSTSQGIEHLGDVNVRNVKALERAAAVASALEVEDLKAYLQWSAVTSCAPYLSEPFVQANFDFYEKTLSGTNELKPRWKRAMVFTESALGEELGKLYCAKYFDEDCKARAQTIVEAVRQALEDRIKEVDWIKSDSTRAEALKKMERFGVKIGYPDKWIDYSTLVLADNDAFLSMVFKARSFAHKRVVKEMNAPTDRLKWHMYPQTVNAYYHPSLNEIVFPSAILQTPFFDKNADDAVNYGAMAAVIGHEMTHGFDDKGSKYNSEGILDDWWTPADADEYAKRVAVMVEQANAFQVHGKSIQGKLTSGENIADLGGLRLALRALKSQKAFNADDKIDGFTPVQRFFLSWAQCWRQNITKERALQLVTIDPHGPNEMRCNSPLSNIPEFHEAFNVSPSAPMFRKVDERVDIW